MTIRRKLSKLSNIYSTEYSDTTKKKQNSNTLLHEKYEVGNHYYYKERQVYVCTCVHTWLTIYNPCLCVHRLPPKKHIKN